MEFNLADLATQDIYKLMTGSVVPRPIAWVSTLGKDGSLNVAPYSYFNAVSADPPAIMFSTGQKDENSQKDTLTNIITSKEFVVNIVNQATAKAMNATAIAAPHGVSEFELAGLNPAPSQSIKTPRVKESPIHFECELLDLYPIGKNTVVFGKILHIHVNDEVYQEPYKINTQALQPVGRLSGNSYANINELFTLERPIYKKD